MSRVHGARVVLVQPRLPRYREPVFQALRDDLAARGIDFDLVHGAPSPAEALRADSGALDWATPVPGVTLAVGSTTLVWQRLPAIARRADLLILTQESRLLSNYPRLFAPRRGRKVAFFGHGRNFQAPRPDALAERVKRRLLHAVDWWFAYTEVSRAWLLAQGYPAARITTVDNAVDVQALRADIAAARAAGAPQALRARLGIAPDAPVGLYCGALYADKRLDLLVAAGDAVRAQCPDFHLLVVGDGPLGAWLRDAAATRAWLHVQGALYGADKAVCFACADVVLNPGLTGLHVLDAFAAGCPFITTRDAPHSPEIAYLEEGENGLLTQSDPQAFAHAALAVLRDATLRARLAGHAAATADVYTCARMARRFGDGIEQALRAPGIRDAR